jgi:hypothetical protein
MTRGRHKIVASDGYSRSLPDKAKSCSDQGEHSEAASGIEPLYRVLQTRGGRTARSDCVRKRPAQSHKTTLSDWPSDAFIRPHPERSVRKSVRKSPDSCVPYGC